MNYISNPTNKIFPEIDLGHYLLREQQESDVADFFAYYSNPSVNRYILCDIPSDLETARRELYFWRNIFYRNDGIYFAIADKNDNGRMIGTIGLSGHNTYNSRIEISYDLNQNYWGYGIMSACVRHVVEYAFREFKVNRVEAYTAIDNAASKNLLLRANFTLEGILRQHRYHKGNYVDVYSFSLLASDFNNI